MGELATAPEDLFGLHRNLRFHLSLPLCSATASRGCAFATTSMLASPDLRAYGQMLYAIRL
jgi:hypothetical protein